MIVIFNLDNGDRHARFLLQNIVGKLFLVLRGHVAGNDDRTGSGEQIADINFAQFFFFFAVHFPHLCTGDMNPTEQAPIILLVINYIRSGDETN